MKEERMFKSTDVLLFYSNNRYSLTVLGWTGSGQKSNLCQGFVQALSRLCPRTKKYRVCPAHDQAWSTVCQASAHFHTPWTGFGHRHPEFVQALSNKLRKSHFSSLDKLWTNFGPGKPSSGFTSSWFKKNNYRLTEFGQPLDMDKPWTQFGFLLLCFQIVYSTNFHQTEIGQPLDMD